MTKYIQDIPFAPEVKAEYQAMQGQTIDDLDWRNEYILYNFEGLDDRYPLTLLETIRSSNTAKAITNTLARFIAGSGCSNDEMGEFIVNPNTGLTVNDLIKEYSNDIAKQEQIYSFVKLGSFKDKIFSIDRIAPQRARLGKPNAKNVVSKVFYSPYSFGTLDCLNNQELVKNLPFYSEKVRATNQINYFNFNREYNEYYPYPLDLKQFELFRTDAQITEFNYNNLKNNFFGGATITMAGDPTKQIPTGKYDDEGQPIMKSWGDIVAEEISRTDLGSENAGKLKMIWVQTSPVDGAVNPAITPFTSNTQADIFTQTLRDVVDNIARVYNVPPILANIQVSGKLGNTEELLNSIDLLIAVTEDRRRTLEKYLNPMLKRLVKWKEKFGEDGITIQPFSMLRSLPNFVWSELSRKQKIEFIRDNFSIEIQEDEIKEEKDVKEVEQPKQEDNE